MANNMLVRVVREGIAQLKYSVGYFFLRQDLNMYLVNYFHFIKLVQNSRF